MASQDTKRALITAGFGALILAIAYMLFKGCGFGKGADTVNNLYPQNVISPTYENGPIVDFSFPPSDINLGTINLNSPPTIDNPCSCGCTDNSAYATAMQGAVNAYTDNLNQLGQQIHDAYVASIPPYVSQFFNEDMARQQYTTSAPELAAGF